MAIKITVWNEYIHEVEKDHKSGKVYPKGIHGAIADFLGKETDIEVTTATLDMPENGLTDEVLNNTDVLFWWAHVAHDKVSDEVVEKIHKRVLEGMGLVLLHSAHYSKIFRKLMGTTCSLRWREVDNENERVWVINNAHPITANVPPFIDIPETEMYGEIFDIPAPDDLVLVSWYKGGEVFRSGCCYNRGKGKVFYFSPGHETFPIFYQPEIQQILINAARWATMPKNSPFAMTECVNMAPAHEKI